MMFRKKQKREVPGLNTTSTADISFMLLILFLVASSMDLDKGIARMLPPIEKEKKTNSAIDSKRVIKISIDANNKLTLDDKPTTLKEIKQRATALINAQGNNHLIQLQTDRKANYDTYLHVQNQLVAAYNTVRNAKAMALFGKKFELLGGEQQEEIAKEVPVRISEIYQMMATAPSQTAEKGGVE